MSVVQLDQDKEKGPMHGTYGTLDAELEVQRTIKRAELMVFLCLHRKVVWSLRWFMLINGSPTSIRAGVSQRFFGITFATDGFTLGVVGKWGGCKTVSGAVGSRRRFGDRMHGM